MDIEKLELDIQNETNNTLIKDGKKKKRKTIIISLITIILIIIIFSLLYVFNNPKSIFESVINNSFNLIKENVSKTNSRYVNGKSNYILNFNGYKFTVDSIYNVDNKKGLFNYQISSKYDGSNLIDLNMYNEENGTYIFFPGLYDKYIKVESESMSKNEIITVINSINKAVISSINGEKISSMSTTINNEKVKKLTLNVDKGVYNKVKKYLKEDKDFMNVVDRYMDEIAFEEDEFTSFDFSIYVKGLNDFMGLEIKDSEDTFYIHKLSNNKYEYNLSNTVNGVFNYKKKEDNTSINLTFNGNGVNGSLNITDEVEKTNNYNASNIKESVDVDDISEEDFTNIYTKLVLNDGVSKLISNFANINS